MGLLVNEARGRETARWIGSLVVLALGCSPLTQAEPVGGDDGSTGASTEVSTGAAPASEGGPLDDDATAGASGNDTSAGADGSTGAVVGGTTSGDSSGASAMDTTTTTTDDTGAAVGESTGGATGSTGGAAAYPESCAELAVEQPGAADGDYELYVDGLPSMPWTAHCVDLATTPRTYLTLPAGLGTNFAQYTAGGGSPGTDVRTIYSRVRIDPIALTIDTNDATFGVSTGALAHGGTVDVLSMPFATAMSCTSGADGVARIDLTGVPFVVAQQFCVAGSGSSGAADVQDGGRIVEIAGGGNCGWAAPDLPVCPYNPFNVNAASVVALQYMP